MRCSTGFSRDSTDRECTDQGWSGPRSSEPRQQSGGGGNAGRDRAQAAAQEPSHNHTATPRHMAQRNDCPSVRINIKKEAQDVARLKDTCAQPNGAHKNNSAHGGVEHEELLGSVPYKLLKMPPRKLAPEVGIARKVIWGHPTISTGLIYKKWRQTQMAVGKMAPNPMPFLFIYASLQMKHVRFSQMFTICKCGVEFLANTCLGFCSKAGLKIEIFTSQVLNQTI